MELPIVIRNAQPDDYRFVLHSWSRSFSTSALVRLLSVVGIRSWLACKSYAKILESRLHEMKIIIACGDEDPTQIYGYIVYERETIHFMYIKEYLRDEGIGNRLKQALPFTPRTTSYPMPFQLFGLAFNPFHLLGIYIDDPRETKAYDSIKESVSVSGN